MDTQNILSRFRLRADVVSRPDLLCLKCQKIGLSDNGPIYSVHYAFVDQLPTRIQIQAALNRDFGSTTVIDPTTVMGGAYTISAKVYSKHALNEFSSPKVYVSNLSQAANEIPRDTYVELGDIIRFAQNVVVTEGQVVGFDRDRFTVRVADVMHYVAADDVIDVKQSKKFYPVDKDAEAYYNQVFPAEFVNLLVNNNAKKVENKGEGRK